MKSDEKFTPKLGRIRSRSLPRRTFLRDVQTALGRASGLHQARPGGKRKFDGSRIGRGAGIGRVVGRQDRGSALRGRRVVIKARLARLSPSGLDGAKAHLRYLQRDGVTREGETNIISSKTWSVE
jgi:hypothetical protein